MPTQETTQCCRDRSATPASKRCYLSDTQARIHDWQKNVAGQPLGNFGEPAPTDFTENQIGFVLSEWFDEFVPHFREFTSFNASVTDIYCTSSVEVGTDVANQSLPRITEQMRKLADDIGDTAFTLLGLLNATGTTVRPGRLNNRTTPASVEVVCVSSLLHLFGQEEYSTELLANGALNSLRRLSKLLGIPFKRTLLAVCDSNDTKLWTSVEIGGVGAKTYNVGTGVYGLANGNNAAQLNLPGERSWRVTNGNGKLIKSPSFTPPDLSFVGVAESAE